jgi:di/tricarboxylate transporter
MPWPDLLLILALVLALGSGRVSTAAAFLAFILAVMLLGRASPREVLALLGEPASVAVLCLAVFSSVLGRLAWLRNLLFSRRNVEPGAIRRRFLGVAGLVSAVMPNTAVVGALMGPAARNARLAPRELLLPLSYMALAGGMVTQFGTSANLMVVGQAARSGVQLGFLDFVLPGIAAALAVYGALLLAAQRVLRPRPGEVLTTAPDLFHVEARVPAGSPLIGKTLAENHLRHLAHFYVAELIREERALAPVPPDAVLREGDTLILVGDVSHVDELMLIQGLEVMEEVRTRPGLEVHLAVLRQSSSLIGSTLKESGFRANFNASVFAIRRGDERLSGKLGEIRLEAGDLLAVAGGRDFLSLGETRANFHLIMREEAPVTALSRRESVIASCLFGGFVVAAILELLDFALLTLLVLSAALLLRLINTREVRSLFPFDLMVALWGSLVLALLVTRSGLDQQAARFVVEELGLASPLAVIFAVMVLAWLLTELLSNVAAALAALPVALQLASITGLPPEAAALAAAFGASASFLIPYGYQTHLMVMSPGNYRLNDFLKLGAIVLVAYSLAALAVLWLLATPLRYWG